MSDSETRATPQQQVVLIDVNVSDLQDLLDGLAPGVQAIVLAPSSDSAQQIAANHLGQPSGADRLHRLARVNVASGS
jgi:hypothetical protein